MTKPSSPPSTRLQPQRRGPAVVARRAVIYQVYIRSFADGNGDGTGDLAGVRSRLGYLRDLGVDAHLVHPLVPVAARRRRLRRRRLPRHRPRVRRRSRRPRRSSARRWRSASARSSTSSRTTSPTEHAWFQAALAAGPGSPERERFWFHPGKGRDGDEMPTRWVVDFQGDDLDPHHEPGRHAGRVVPAPVRARAARPELDPPRRASASTRTCSGSGSTAASPASASTRRRCWSRTRRCPRCPSTPGPGEHPHTDRDELHDVYRGWRAIADSYPGTRVLVGEVWLPDADRFAAYLRPDEMHTAFNFDFMARPWDARELRESIDLHARRARPGRRAGDLGAVQPRRHPAGHALRPRGHVVRVRRQALRHPDRPGAGHAPGPRAPRCSRAALPGSLYIYQGDELGLPEVEDLPLDLLAGPDALPLRAASTRAGTAAGCRCPGAATSPPFGFCPDTARRSPWLPQPADWAALTVAAQEADPARCCASTATALRAPPAEPGLATARSTWLDRAPTACSRSAAATRSCAS